MVTSKRIFKNTFILITSQFVQRLLSLLLFAIIARRLGEQVFGMFSYGMALAGLLVVFADFGINVLLVREVAVAKTKGSPDLVTAILTKLVLALVTLLALYGMAALLRPAPGARILIFLLGFLLCIRSLTATHHAIFRAYERMEFEGIFNSLDHLVTAAAGIILILLGGDILMVVAVMVFVSVINLVMSYHYVKKMMPSLAWKMDFQQMKAILRKAAPFGMIAVFGTVCFKIDTIMLAYFWNDAQVAWYNAAFKIVFALMFIPTAFVDSVFPVVSRLAESVSAFKTAYAKSIRMIWQVGIPLGVGITAAAPFIIHVFYGADYDKSIIALQILIWVGILLAATSLQSSVLAAARQTHKIALVSALNAVANIILNLLLIPEHGHVGAGIASLVTLVISITMLSYFCYAQFGSVGNMVSLVRIVVASIPMAGFFIIFNKVNPVVTCVPGIIFYFVSSLLIGAITREDLRQWRKAIY